MLKLFEFLSQFDLITPTIGVIEDLINDPTLLQSNSWTFFVPYHRSLDGGWNKEDIRNLMHQHGIKTWHWQFTNGEFFFSVNLEQAQWAEYLLLRHGVPLNEKYLGAPRPNQKSTRQKHQRSKGGTSWLPDDFFETLFG